MLRLDGVTAGYGSAEVIHRISFEVKAGEVVSLVGANGVGKTTTLRAIVGVVPCRGGRIFFEGNLISGLSPHEVVKRGIALVPEGRQIFGSLSVYENLLVGCYAQYWRLGSKGRLGLLETVFDLFPILKARAGQRGGTLSGGEQQMLAIGRALMAQPRLLLLDEPSLGLAPLVVESILAKISDLNKTGLTILLVEQNMMVASTLMDRGCVMKDGAIVLEGSRKELESSGVIREIYLRGQLARIPAPLRSIDG